MLTLLMLLCFLHYQGRIKKSRYFKTHGNLGPTMTRQMASGGVGVHEDIPVGHRAQQMPSVRAEP